MSNFIKKIGRYEIIAEIGRGAMGVVFLAKDPLIERQLAIKTIRLFGLMQDEREEFLKRFYQEAKAAGGLSHPNIVTVHDVGFDEDKEIHYIVMEYVPGKTLKEIIQQKVPLTFEEKAMILEKVADALSYAHSKGVIHRDIKPANIIISGPDSIKITDFGIAKLQSSHLTTNGQYLGTPTYMSPEQVLGKNIDKRSDIFSFGIVAYELLSYQKPFYGNNLTEVSHKIAYEDPIPLKEICPDCPEILLYIVDKSLSKNPALRFQDAKEISEELKKYYLIPRQEKEEGEATVILKEKPKEESFETIIAKEKKKSLKARFLNFFKSKKGLEFLAGEVYLKWIFLIIFGWIGFWFFIIGYLYLSNLPGKIESLEYRYFDAMELRKEIGKGKAFIEKGDYEKAIKFFEKVLIKIPSSPYLIKQVTDLRNLIEYNVKIEERGYQINFYMKKGEEALRKKDYFSARIYFSKVLEIEPNNLDAKAYIKKLEGWQKEKKPIILTNEKKEEIKEIKEPEKIEVSERKLKEEYIEPKLYLYFRSPIEEGYFTVSMDGKQIIRKAFNFFQKKGFLKKEFSGGEIEEQLPAIEGKHKIQVWITKIGKGGYTSYGSIEVDMKASHSYIIKIFLNEEQKKLDLKLEEKKIAN